MKNQKSFKNKFFIGICFLILIGFVQSAYSNSERIVYFNHNSLIYHGRTCQYVPRCTKNCIWVKLSEALARRARACKVCHGN